MTFDEARRYLIANFEDMNLEAVISVLSSVRDEYAPTIEMTKSQKHDLLMMKNNEEHITDIISYIDGPVVKEFFDSFWKPLTEGELVQAWQHPETIKTIDE